MAFYYLENDSGHIGYGDLVTPQGHPIAHVDAHGLFDTQGEAISAALTMSAQTSDVIRVYRTDNGNDSRVVALALSGVLYRPEPL